MCFIVDVISSAIVTPFEIIYLCLEPFLPTIPFVVRKRLLHFAKLHSHQPQILDVGGRKSYYTIGVPAAITITDIPRKSALQSRLNLGINPQITAQTYKRRSNISQILYDDMTRSTLPDNSFDYVVAVEVLEHVKEDVLFIRQVHRVLKPGGVFVMTTPNGDFVENTNPDHIRHYTRENLENTLNSVFEHDDVDYAIIGGYFYKMGNKSWSIKKPLQTILSMIGSLINKIQSKIITTKNQPEGTQNLIATAKNGC